MTLAKYARDNDLLEQPGWKRFKRLIKREKKYVRMLRQARLAQSCYATKTKFGVEVPRTLEEALEMDKKDGNDLWQEAVKKEMTQIHEYGTFKSEGKGVAAPTGHKQIKVHLVFDVKYDLRRKARLVAGGHLTDPPKESVYSGVVSTRSIRMCLFLAELNGLTICAADVGNAYLEANTKEKLYIIGGKEFGDLQGHTLTFKKALYGLRTSGARWHEKMADSLRDLGWTPTYADPDVWMLDSETHYEYICVYVDDILICGKKPLEIIEKLKRQYTLKGVGAPEYYLGGDFERREEPEKVLTWGSKTYINKIIEMYKTQFGDLPEKDIHTPLDPGDHPELDVSAEVDSKGIQQYQSMIGMLQWAVTLGRIDIYCAVMTMSRFRVQPRQGHLDRLKRIFGYLRTYKKTSIKFRTAIPDYGEIPVDIGYD
ncbi:MAG: reverse transcriptase domain-containing protein, partial [Gaiellaceae bacterium]